MKFNNYEEMVRSFLKSDSSEKFGSFNSQYAKFIITEFIKESKYSIEILSGNCLDDFYSENEIYGLLEKKACEFGRAGAVRIITLDGSTNGVLRALETRIEKKQGKKVLEYILAKYSGEDQIKHFLVCDSKRYRLEEKHELFKRGALPDVTKAEVCCNDEEKSKDLESFFDHAWDLLLK